MGYADEYENLFSKMIESWRHQWKLKDGQKSFPFYFVQIATFNYSNLGAAARVRQAQYNVMKNVDHTGMAVTIDLGNMKNIHYTHKKEVGERLALIALAKNYGFKHIIFEGPACKKITWVKDKLHLNFDQQLFTTGQEKLRGFEIGHKEPGSDSIIFLNAKSVINGNEVIVWNDKVKYPLMVRYAWLAIGDANLVNKTGLPAYPFQQKIL